MTHLKLTKGLSYMGYGITATRQAPDVFVEDEAVASSLLDTGYFSEGDGTTTAPKAPATGTIEAIDTMGVTKLRSYAKERGLDLTWPPGTSADDLREDIRVALAAKDDEDDAAQFTDTGGGDTKV